MRIAIIAHDGKKADMVSFLLNHKEILKKVELVATKTTGGLVENAGLQVTKVLSGPVGGDAQIAALAAEQKLDMIIFFRDPLDKHPHEPDVQMLLRICDVHNIALATNIASARLLFSGLLWESKSNS